MLANETIIFQSSNEVDVVQIYVRKCQDESTLFLIVHLLCVTMYLKVLSCMSTLCDYSLS